MKKKLYKEKYICLITLPSWEKKIGKNQLINLQNKISLEFGVVRGWNEEGNKCKSGNLLRDVKEKQNFQFILYLIFL